MIKYYPQILLFLCMANNQVAKFWEGNNEKWITWSGITGYPKWYHYWVVFDHALQPFYYMAICIMLILFPLKGNDAKFALFTFVCFCLIIGAELLIYMYDGNNFKNEQNYYVYLISFLVAQLIGKKWIG